MISFSVLIPYISIMFIWRQMNPYTTQYLKFEGKLPILA